LQDVKEISRLKSGFTHATRGGWEQIPLLKDQLLESQEKLLNVLNERTAIKVKKEKKEAALTEAWKALSGMNSKAPGWRKTPVLLRRLWRRPKGKLPNQRSRLLQPKKPRLRRK
jgi:hypothetical protein